MLLAQVMGQQGDGLPQETQENRYPTFISVPYKMLDCDWWILVILFVFFFSGIRIRILFTILNFHVNFVPRGFSTFKMAGWA